MGRFDKKTRTPMRLRIRFFCTASGDSSPFELLSLRPFRLPARTSPAARNGPMADAPHSPPQDKSGSSLFHFYDQSAWS